MFNKLILFSVLLIISCTRSNEKISIDINDVGIERNLELESIILLDSKLFVGGSSSISEGPGVVYEIDLKTYKSKIIYLHSLKRNSLNWISGFVKNQNSIYFANVSHPLKFAERDSSVIFQYFPTSNIKKKICEEFKVLKLLNSKETLIKVSQESRNSTKSICISKNNGIDWNKLNSISKFRDFDENSLFIYENQIYGIAYIDGLKESDKAAFHCDLLRDSIKQIYKGDYSNFQKICFNNGKLNIVSQVGNCLKIKEFGSPKVDKSFVLPYYSKNSNNFLRDVIFDKDLIIVIISQAFEHKIYQSLDCGNSFNLIYTGNKFFPYLYENRNLYGLEFNNDLVKITFN